jgi:hypothetical protein
MLLLLLHWQLLHQAALAVQQQQQQQWQLQVGQQRWGPSAT